MMILVTGGSGSGKSEIAENICAKLSIKPMYYIATMKSWDDECERRIEKHRRQRQGKGFITVEAPQGLLSYMANMSNNGSALLECVGNLTANEQFGAETADTVKTVTDEILELNNHLKTLVAVTNEIFSDVPVNDEITRAYMRNMGNINCILAKNADVVIEAVGGLPVIWKGETMYNEIMA